MSIALWCVLAAGMLPYVFGLAAKFGMPIPANHNPREYTAGLQGWRKRSYWAHQNSFEAFPLFAAAVLTAQLTHGASSATDHLALAFVAARVVYGISYITDRATLRSCVWAIGIACVIALFVHAAR